MHKIKERIMAITWSDIVKGFPHRKSIESAHINGFCPSYWLYDGEKPVMAWLTEHCLYDVIDTTGICISEQGLIELEESIREIGRRLAELPFEDQRRIEIEVYGV